jgi:hypothetical protein
MEDKRIEALFLYSISQAIKKDHSIYNYLKQAYG